MSSVGVRRDVLLRILRAGVHETCLELVRRTKRRRSCWVRKWIERRARMGASSNLLRELAAEDPKSYLNMMRMSEVKFDELLDMITPHIRKQNTTMRSALPCKLKLQITLRYLATGDSFMSLQYLFRVPHNTISVFLPEVLKALYEVLNDFIKVSIKLICWGFQTLSPFLSHLFFWNNLILRQNFYL